MAPASPEPAPRLRPATDGDAEFLLRLYASTREDELAAVDWPQEHQEAFVRQQFEAQAAWYREQYASPATTFDVIEVGDEPVGRLYVARWEREVRIVDISVLPAWRGRGVGSRLLSALLAEGDAAGKPVSIHVERFNPALRLYVRLGFALKEDKGVYLLLERPAGVADSP